MAIKKELLIKAAEELNEVMGLRPPIDTNEDEETIKEKILKALELREEEDEFSPEVEKVFDQLEEDTDNEVDEVIEDEEELENEELEEEEETDKVKEKKKAKKAKVKKEKKANNKNNDHDNRLTRLSFIESLISEGKYTRKEIMEKALKQFPHMSKATVHTILSSSKNPKYKKFKRLAIEDERGVMSFVSRSSANKKDNEQKEEE